MQLFHCCREMRLEEDQLSCLSRGSVDERARLQRQVECIRTVGRCSQVRYAVLIQLNSRGKSETFLEDASNFMTQIEHFVYSSITFQEEWRLLGCYAVWFV
jgi:hypothetical protein